MIRVARQVTIGTLLLLLAGVAPSRASDQYVYVTQWGSRDVSPGNFNWVPSLEVDRVGNVYVADQLNQRIQKFTSAGTFLTLWGGSGAGPGQFNYPTGISVDSLENIYVADSWNFRIQKFTNTGVYAAQWGQQGSDDGEFELASGVAADRFGYVYTQDPINNRIQKFTNTGAYITQWGGLTDPSDVAVDLAGNVYVTDANRVVKYASTGTYLTQWGSLGGGPGQFRYPEGLGVDGAGNVYVAETYNNRIQKFTSNGAFVTQWGGLGAGNGQFNFPMDVAMDDSGNVYVTDTRNYRIQKFRRDAPPVLLVHGICGDAADWQAFGEELTAAGFDVQRFQYGSRQYSDPPAVYVANLAAKLDSMQSDRVAVVAHSMGGLVAREYMKRQIESGRTNRIAQLVTLGTPHHGSDLVTKLYDSGIALDLGCTLLLPGTPCDIFGKLKKHFGCLGDRRSTRALLDMTPASSFLNQLNYGTQATLYDTVGTKGWDTHQPETKLIPGVYYASIAGTRSFCPPLFSNLKSSFWGGGSGYHANDGVVATGSGMITNTQAFRAQDVDLPTGTALTHANFAPFLCGPSYYSLQTLAQKVATILETSPTNPPVPGPQDLPAFGLTATQAIAEDSLRITPAITDTISPGHMALPTVTILPTSMMMVTLVSDDARLTLQAPNGTVITPNDTSAANGVNFFGVPADGFEGFLIANPLAGAWTLRIDATASAALQQYGCVASYATSTEARLGTPSPAFHAGDSLRVHAQVSSAGGLRTDVAWTCRVIGPDNLATNLDLYDDGTHGDSLPGDGLYGNAQAPGAGLGLYRIVAAAAVPGGGVFAAGSGSELAYYDDLTVAAEDIWLSKNVVQAADSVTVFATVHNGGSRAALGVEVEIRDRRLGVLLGTSTVDIASGSAAMVQAPWNVAAPDTHAIQVSVSPFTFASEASYVNNVAEREVVLGTPVGVEPANPSGSVLWLAPPRPNPSSGAVSFAFRLPTRGAAALGIFDVLGRRVRRWGWSDLAAGTHTVEWNGRDEKDSAVAPGILFCRLNAGGQVKNRKLVFRP